MVYALVPVDPNLRGTQKYYIFAAGTYKVGRKDCDVVVQTDTSISRVHAEIIIEKMAVSESCSQLSSSHSVVHIIDRSKYGTFVNKDSGSEGAQLHKDEETTIKDGDLLTFGTGNATFRFSFVPIVAFCHSAKSKRIDKSLQATLTSIGAHATRKWSDECTHVLVDEMSLLTNELIEAIIAKKQIISVGWLQILAEQKICGEIPSCARHIPILKLYGTEIKAIEVRHMENCLADYTFVLGSPDKYEFGENFCALVKLSGAKAIFVDEYCSDSQKSVDELSTVVLVVPARTPLEFNNVRELCALPKVTDVKLVAAVLSGHLEAAFIEPPPFIVTSSHSTDETIVADSENEIDSATLTSGVGMHKTCDDKVVECDVQMESTEKVRDGAERVVHLMDNTEKVRDSAQHVVYLVDNKEKGGNGDKRFAENKSIRKFEEIGSTSYSDEKGISLQCNDSHVSKFVHPKDRSTRVIKREDRSDQSLSGDGGRCDVIYSQNLIIQDRTASVVTSHSSGPLNFKRFRKTEAPSGNSINNLVPFSKDPYRESDGDYNQSEFFRQERKRKQMEAVAEDLFNNEKARKRSAAGTSLHALLAGR